MSAIAVISAALFAVSCAERAAPDAGADIAGKAATLVDEAGFSGTILVADRSGVVYEQGFGLANIEQQTPMTPETKFVIASMTKSFTAVLVMQLVGQGKLSLDDTIADYLSEYDAPYSGQVTIAQMLQNRSGIPHTIDMPGWFDNDYKRSLTPETFLEAAAALPLRFEPGTDYYYSNINYYLLGLIIDQVAGEPYEAALEDHILSPLGMTATGQIYDAEHIENLAQNYLREDGELIPVPIVNPALFRAAASQYSNVQDLYKWNVALQGAALLSDASKNILFDPEKPMAWTVAEVPLREGAEPARILTYNGELAGYTSIISYFPDHDGTIVILNNNNAGYDAILSMTLALAAEAFAPTDDEEDAN